MTVEEFHAIENPVGMTFWFSMGTESARRKGVCIKTFREMALMKYQKREDSDWQCTTYLHCRQLRRTEDEPDDVIERPKLEPDPVKMAMFTPEERRNRGKKPSKRKFPAGKFVKVKDMTTGEVYESIRSAERALGMTPQTLKEYLKRGKARNGHVFVRVEE